MAKSAKKSVRAKAEPTLHDVMGVLGSMHNGMEAIHDRVHNIDVRLTVIEREQRQMKSGLGDIQDDLTTALAAVDKDTEMLYNHERRLKRLEAKRS